MSTPKPGQIRCPTCLRSTPPAAFCTQCGSPIPPSARTRPRGLDREELEERVRRRPAENAFRRGGSPDDPGRPAYVPFEPEPEDSLAVRGEEEATRHVDNLPPEPDITRPVDEPVRRDWSAPPPAEPEWPASDRDEVPAAAAVPPPPVEPEPSYEEPAHEESVYAADDYDEAPYGRPEDAYAYPYQAAEDRRDGGTALPIIGFVVLSVLALAVGAVLAGLLDGEEPIGQNSPSPSVVASQEPSVEPSLEPSVEPSPSEGEATPQPTDGPVAFEDGALLTIQPCGSNGYRQQAVGDPEENACQVDGSTVSDGRIWAFVVFSDAAGSDQLQVRLILNGQAEDQQEVTIGSVLNDCGANCSGLIYGATYQGLLPGDYRLELYRNGDFADSAAFTVEG
ncbi:MAG TPA: hypothetical protein VF071_02740 [Candidatus Limnocylindria bacterium]